MMKKLIFNILAAVAVLCISVTAFAATSTVSVKNNIVTADHIEYNYEAGSEDEYVVSVKPLLNKLDELGKQDSVVQTITVSSESADSSAVEFRLRLSIPENEEKPEVTPSPDEYSALDYYNIQVKDTSGTILYSYEEEHERKENAEYKDISLGLMNTMRKAESKIFNITISVNENLNKSAVAKAAKKLDWSIVSSAPITATPTPAPTPTTVATEKPEVTLTPSVGVSEDKNGVITVQPGEYVCGKDFDEDRYTATGGGKLAVYDKTGKLKTNVVLKAKNDKTSNGVEDFIINLLDGEKIVVASETKLTPYVAPKATAKPKATTKPASSTSTSSSNKTSTSSKNNPKTGDNTPVAGIAVVGIAAVGALAYIEIKKRKND